MLQSSKATRLYSLDVFRGLIVALMIIVNSPGNPTSYAFLEHSAWDGCSLADFVFPSFLFIVGISITMAFRKHPSLCATLPKIFRRSCILFALGLLLNAFPHPALDSLRIFGVLQRIALCYFFASILFLVLRLRYQLLVFFGLLLFYWLIMCQFPLDPTNNLAAMIDRMFFSSHHLYNGSYDPEGLFTTLPALATTLLGQLTGAWLLSKYSAAQKMVGLLVAACLCLILALLVQVYFPINKNLWSSSYVLWTGGWALFMMAVCYFLIEIKAWLNYFRPFEILGQQALLAYVLHVFFLKVQAMIHVASANETSRPLRYVLSEYLFGWTSLQNASLLYAISYMLLWLLILSQINRLKGVD
jgi:predicted acyltransferase